MRKSLSKEDLKDLISKWESSGLPKSVFCREQKISYYRFNYWQRLNKKASNQEAGKFVPLKVIKPTPIFSQRVILRGKSGIEISIPLNSDSAKLIRDILQ